MKIGILVRFVVTIFLNSDMLSYDFIDTYLVIERMRQSPHTAGHPPEAIHYQCASYSLLTICIPRRAFCGSLAVEQTHGFNGWRLTSAWSLRRAELFTLNN
jgi:hypothetical protein